ncbi:hypothetical protein KPL70_021313 [Citrus sinensis]|nr:hypothetical protein KPL70_021313 [Citrus sinensis]
MTVFAFDNMSIFSSSPVYISNVRFHIVPNRYLRIGDLHRLPAGTTLPTLERGQSLTVTRGGVVTGPFRINLVRIMVPDIMNSLKIIVYGVNLPFPHFGATAFDVHSIRLTDTDGGEYFDGTKPTAAAGTNTVSNSLLTAVSTCSVVGVIAWGDFKFSKIPQRNVELKQQPKYFPIRCTSRDSKSRRPVGRIRSEVPELYKRQPISFNSIALQL